MLFEESLNVKKTSEGFGSLNQRADIAARGNTEKGRKQRKVSGERDDERERERENETKRCLHESMRYEAKRKPYGSGADPAGMCTAAYISARVCLAHLNYSQISQ